MYKRIRLSVVVTLLPLYAVCQQNITWITHFGSATPYYGIESGRDIATDSEGNIYVAGEFAESILVDGKKITSSGDKDIFLAKLNPSGRVLWISNFGGERGDWCGGICLDENSDIFLTGSFRGKITLGDSVFNSNSWYDIFLVKINADGRIVWSRAFTGTGGNSTTAITKDNYGYLYTTGYYSEILNFDNFQLQGPTARSDLFVVKFDTDGKVIWAKSAKGNANNYGNSITVDNDDHLYLTGFMWDSVYFDNHLLISTNPLGLFQAYVAKMDASSGDFLWAAGGGGDGWSEGMSIGLDNNGDIVISGWYRNDLYFGNDSVTNGGNDEGPDDIFIAKFNTQGSLKWLKSTTCNLYSNSNDLTINSENDIILTGYFRGQIHIEDYDFSSTVPSYHDIYVLKLDKDGLFKWFKSLGGNSPMNDIGYGVTSTDSSIFVTGFYSSNSRFDYKLLNCNGASDIFVLKLSYTLETIPEDNHEDFLIYPNPCSDRFFIRIKSADPSFQFKLLDIAGREMPFKSIVQLQLSEIDITHLSGGIYFLRIHDLNNNSFISRKIIKK